ncbi:erythromycin esterase family protein [Pannus brasiliensis CCIBt3594]|uniref:Erythromycin esterase family protein n=1 Tax=Pannus brasiliensis CCIBt3594 TaxID=1427578 RepID=A0AAW9QTW0_9CHRO
MTNTTTIENRDAIRQIARPFSGTPEDLDPLIDAIDNARFVLIGEASHGTHEFYDLRAEITKRLIREKGFIAVAVEADWPDAYRVNRYARGLDGDMTPEEALRGFDRFPTWMWRNTDVVNFIGWLREYNDGLPAGRTKAGFYGLDLYSLYTSIAEVLRYLDRVDPEAAARARDRYSCLEDFREDSQKYGFAASFGLTESCEDAVVNQLLDLQRRVSEYTLRDGSTAEEDFFYAEGNARLVQDAERYYRSMFQERVSSWNLRDRHMAETLELLVEHLERRGNGAKVVVWAHNSHLGDARATDRSGVEEWNVGQLVREKYGTDAFLIGFSTFTGTVTAAVNWDDPPRLQRVRPALPDSYEALFHETGLPRFWLNLRDANRDAPGLRERRLERAIGVIYRPETERFSHYFYACLPDQFDAMIHIDDTRGVEPLDRMLPHESIEPPETFPSAL